MKKIILTVTSVIEVDDSVKIEEIKGHIELGDHINVMGHKVQPTIHFLEYEGNKSGDDSWGPVDEDISDSLFDGIIDEGYTIIEIADEEK